MISSWAKHSRCRLPNKFERLKFMPITKHFRIKKILHIIIILCMFLYPILELFKLNGLKILVSHISDHTVQMYFMEFCSNFKIKRCISFTNSPMSQIVLSFPQLFQLNILAYIFPFLLFRLVFVNFIIAHVFSSHFNSFKFALIGSYILLEPQEELCCRRLWHRVESVCPCIFGRYQGQNCFLESRRPVSLNVLEDM